MKSQRRQHVRSSQGHNAPPALQRPALKPSWPSPPPLALFRSSERRRASHRLHRDHVSTNVHMLHACFTAETPSLLPFNQSSFSFRPLNREVRGPYRSHSEPWRPQRAASRPPGLDERGWGGRLERPRPVLLPFVYGGTRGRPNTPPRPRQHRNTMGNKEVARSSVLTRAHAVPLYLTQSTWYYLEITRRESGVGGGWGVDGGSCFAGQSVKLNIQDKCPLGWK